MTPLEKIRQLPEKTRNIIFWVVVISVSVAMIFFWVKAAKERTDRVASSGGSELSVPQITIPSSTDESIKQLKQVIDQLKQDAQETGTTTK